MSVDCALVFPSLLLEGSSSTNMNGFCVTSLKVKGVKVFKNLTTRLYLGLRVIMSVDCALVFPSLLLERSSSTNMNGFCVTSLKVRGVNVLKKLTTRLCLGLRMCMSVDCALVFPSLLLEGSSSTNMNGFCVTSLKVKGVKVFKNLTTRLCLGLRVCMSVDWALVFPSLLLEGSSSTNMNGCCVTSLKVKGVKVFKKLTTRLCLGLRVCMSVDWALVFPSLLLEGSSSTNMNGFCVTSLKVKGVKVFKKLTTRLCLGLRVCMSVDWALVFPSLLLEGSSSTNMNGFCVTSLKVKGVKVFKNLTTRLCLGLRVCMSVDCALVFPSLLLEGSSSTNMNGFCVTSLKVKGVKVFKNLTTRLCLGLRVCMSVDCSLVFPSLLLEGSSSTNMKGFCVTSLKVKGVKVFKNLTTRLCLGLRVCMSVDCALVFPSLLLEGSSSTNMNGFCVTSLKVREVKVRLDNITLFTARLSAFSCKTN